MTDTSFDGETIPSRLAVGQVIQLTVADEEVVVVGAAPVGHPVVLSATEWETLRRWRLDKLSVSARGVVSRSGRFQQPTARFLSGIAYVPHKGVVFANGNPLDLRPSNLRVLPWSRIRREREMRRLHESARAVA